MKISAAMISVTLMATTVAVHADDKKHQAKFCTAMTSLKADLKDLDAIGPDSKVRDLRTAIDKVGKDVKALDKEGGKIKTPAGKQFRASADRLVTEASNVPDDMTIAQAKSRIKDDISNVEQSAQQLSDEAGCSGATPDKTMDKAMPDKDKPSPDKPSPDTTMP